MRTLPRGASPFRTDGSNDFAQKTMKYRIPENIRSVLERYPDLDDTCKAEIETLAESIAVNGLIPRLQYPAPDMDMWEEFLRCSAGGPWLEAEWFFAETYAYRLLIQAVRHWETGFDPFLATKNEELYSGAPVRLLEEYIGCRSSSSMENVVRSFQAAVWGNRIDLSYAVSKNHGSRAETADLILDDSPAAAEIIDSGSGAVHIVTDNAGSELAADLLLGRELLSRGLEVFLHVKQYPTYVSDATAQDVYRTIEYFRRCGSPPVEELGGELSRFHTERRLVLAPDLYWNSAYFLDSLPERIGRLFRTGTLVIIKGDMNYRRCFFDTLWAPKTRPAEILPGVGAPCLFLRSLKSDALAGIDVSERARLDIEDPEWNVNGKRGIIQLVEERV